MSHCDDTLRQIGQALAAYQNNGDGSNPEKLETLIETSTLTAWDFVCPAGAADVGESAYVYRGEDLYASVHSKMIVAYDHHPVHRGRRNILFANGRVTRPKEEDFQKAANKDNTLRTELGLPEKPI